MLFTYLLLAQKRVFKDALYVICLFLLPMVVLGIRNGTNTGAEIYRITVFAYDDSVIVEDVKASLNKPGVIQVQTAKDERAVVSAIKSGNANLGIVFPKNYDGIVNSYVENGYSGSHIKMYVKEKTPEFFLIKEVINSVIISKISFLEFRNVIKNKLDITKYSDEELFEYYEQNDFDVNFLEQVTTGGEKNNLQNALLVPLRGISAIWFFLFLSVAQLYILKDNEAGVLSNIAFKKKEKIALAHQLIFAFDGLFIFIVSIYLGGVFSGTIRELESAIFFAIASLLVSNLLRFLSGESIALYCNTVFIFLIAISVMTPVFFNIKLMPMQMLLPQYLYLNSIYDRFYLVLLEVYCLIGGLVMLGIRYLSGRIRAKRI